jgi:DNA-binding response OmpR family regulator
MEGAASPEEGGSDMAQDHRAPREGADDRAGATRAGHGEGRLVLVLEDEPNISEAIRFILRRDGWDVLSHGDGQGALALIEARRPALVILDVMLPGQSGLDILQAIRSRPAVAALPVIVLTAKGHAADRDRAMRSGASLYMAKPFANAELLAAVRQLVGP